MCMGGLRSQINLPIGARFTDGDRSSSAEVKERVRGSSLYGQVQGIGSPVARLAAMAFLGQKARAGTLQPAGSATGSTGGQTGTTGGQP